MAPTSNYVNEAGLASRSHGYGRCNMADEVDGINMSRQSDIYNEVGIWYKLDLSVSRPVISALSCNLATP